MTRLPKLKNSWRRGKQYTSPVTLGEKGTHLLLSVDTVTWRLLAQRPPHHLPPLLTQLPPPLAFGGGENVLRPLAGLLVGQGGGVLPQQRLQELLPRPVHAPVVYHLVDTTCSEIHCGYHHQQNKWYPQRCQIAALCNEI